MTYLARLNGYTADFPGFTVIRAAVHCTCLSIGIGDFSCHCDQIPGKGTLKKGKSWFWHAVWRYSHGREGVVSGSWRGWSRCIHSQEAEDDAGVQPWDQVMEWSWSHLDMGLSTLINTVWLSGSQSVGHIPFGDHIPDILHIRLHYIKIRNGSKITVMK